MENNVLSTTENALEKEFLKAASEQRQPNCPRCGKPLKVIQYQLVRYVWVWDKELSQYVWDSESNSDPPECAKCGYGDWNLFADTSSFEEYATLCLSLGLTQ